MPIRIVSDSTCDLTSEVSDQYGIGIIPCYINVGEESYLDGVDLSRRDFYDRLPYFESRPKTSSPGLGIYTEVYERLEKEGADQIISLHIHSGYSNLANTARLAAEASDRLKVTVVEAGQLSLGLGFIALAAAEAAQEGRPIEEILQLIKDRERRTFVLIAFDTLDYLHAGGRAPGLVVSVASLLRIKPIVQLYQGELRMIGQERTFARSIDHLVKKVEKLGRLEKLAVLHTNALEKAENLAEKIRAQVSQQLDIWITEATPVLGVHVGPGAVGLAYVLAE